MPRIAQQIIGCIFTKPLRLIFSNAKKEIFSLKGGLKIALNIFRGEVPRNLRIPAQLSNQPTWKSLKNESMVFSRRIASCSSCSIWLYFISPFSLFLLCFWQTQYTREQRTFLLKKQLFQLVNICFSSSQKVEPVSYALEISKSSGGATTPL
jgi:hypothetical protein